MDGRQVEVIVDERTAAQVEGTRRAAFAGGQIAHFDFNHEHGTVSFYPTEFFWRDNVGVICRGVLTEAGKRALVSGEYKYFSPRFAIDKGEGPPYRVTCVLDEANMGTIAHAAAFGELLKLDVKRSDDLYY
jgi:phage I-like protein